MIRVNKIISLLMVVCLFIMLLPTSVQSAIPGQPDGSYIDIAAAGAHTVALKEDGTVVVWGHNGFGQSNVPKGLKEVKQVAAGSFFSAALKEDGTVVVWGDNEYGQLNVPEGLTNVKAISAGSTHILALKEDGTVVAWGNNEYGQLNVPEGLTGVKALAAGYIHSVALKEDGTIVVWTNSDDNDSYEPGNDDYLWYDPKYNERVVWEELTDVKAIAAGGYITMALKEDGTIVAWSVSKDYDYDVERWGQIEVPEGLTDVKDIAADSMHSAALKEDGTVVVWGRFLEGQSDVPEDLTSVIDIAVGISHTVALTEDGKVIGWGYNAYGQCNSLEGMLEVEKLGDLNSDGSVNSIDCVLMKRYILGIIDDFVVQNDLYAADVNGDGIINSIDYELIKKYILGIIPNLPQDNIIYSDEQKAELIRKAIKYYLVESDDYHLWHLDEYNYNISVDEVLLKLQTGPENYDPFIKGRPYLKPLSQTPSASDYDPISDGFSGWKIVISPDYYENYRVEVKPNEVDELIIGF